MSVYGHAQSTTPADCGYVAPFLTGKPKKVQGCIAKRLEDGEEGRKTPLDFHSGPDTGHGVGIDKGTIAKGKGAVQALTLKTEAFIERDGTRIVGIDG